MRLTAANCAFLAAPFAVLSWVRRETGKGYVVQVHCDEGVATHVAPDPWAVLREDDCEASVGERIGQPLGRESVINSGADVVHSMEGKTGGCVIASARRTRRGLRPWHVRTLPAREPDFLPMVKGKLGGAVTPPAYRFDLPSRLIQHSTVLALSRTLRAGASAAARHPGQRLRAALCRWAGAGRRDVGSDRTKGLLSAPPLC